MPGLRCKFENSMGDTSCIKFKKKPVFAEHPSNRPDSITLTPILLGRRAPMTAVIFMIFFFLTPGWACAESHYPVTTLVLQNLYNDEIQALYNYTEFSAQAAKENLANIALLFRAFATSETIHARNFKAQLTALGIEVDNSYEPEVNVASTKENLKLATEVELKEINTKYPEYLKQIKPENHAEAVNFITYAWKSEKQHSKLIKKINSGTGTFYGLLKKIIEKDSFRFFVCMNCGSTLKQMPETSCPICGGPASGYQEVEKPELSGTMPKSEPL